MLHRHYQQKKADKERKSKKEKNKERNKYPSNKKGRKDSHKMQ
jgi:hypothetical protein